MSGKLESAMSSLVELFECYALKDGDRLHLSRREMSNMFHEELGDLIKRSKDPQKTAEILTNMDQNLDGQVDFEEFISMVTKFTMCSFDYFTMDRTVVYTSRCGNPW
uniref:EF-hand domain-containing protein n=1 Tax=Dicentrarchus labrax TaxID=13489 RepID=A0A8P4G2J3_DICLA